MEVHSLIIIVDFWGEREGSDGMVKTGPCSRVLEEAWVVVLDH